MRVERSGRVSFGYWGPGPEGCMGFKSLPYEGISSESTTAACGVGYLPF